MFGGVLHTFGDDLQLGWFLAIVKKLIERNLQGARQFLQRFDRGNRMAVFYARDVATKQT